MGSKRSRSKRRRAQGGSRPFRDGVVATSTPRGNSLAYALLAVAVLAVWVGTLRNDFVAYDDESYVTRNPHVLSGLTLPGIAWAFATGYNANWHPVTWLSHMLDVELFGTSAAGHHATSLLLHLANTLLIYRLLSGMTGARTRSAVAAALFALHPLRVESVAWVAERKDVLGTFFGLMAIGAYVRYVRSSKRSAYAVSLVLFALSLASKPMLVTLPFLLLLLDRWPLARWNSTGVEALVLEKLPYLALSAASSVLTYFVQRSGGATTEFVPPLVLRIDNAVLSYLRYIGKLFYPVRLAVFYPHPAVTHGWLTWAAAALLLVITAACLFFDRRYPYLLVGWLWYIGALVPTIGLVQAGRQSIADRYTYIPTIGLTLIAVWGITDLTKRWIWRRAVLASATTAVLVVLSVLTLRQIGRWRDTVTLFEHAVSVTRDNDTIELDLGTTYFRQGRRQEARAHFERAARIARHAFDAHYALSIVNVAEGRTDEAVAELEEALRLKPDFAKAHAYLGTILVSQRRSKEAIGHFEQVQRLAPDLLSAEMLYAFGAALDGEDRVPEAIERYRAALRLEPDFAAAHSNLGLVLLRKTRAPEAALPHLRETARLLPGSLQAHADLATCLATLGRHEEASQELREGLRLSPGSPGVLSLLALELASAADGDPARTDEAIAQARTACELTRWKDPVPLDALARIQANAGRFNDALETGRRAVVLAQESKATDLAARLERRLASYRQKRTISLFQDP